MLSNFTITLVRLEKSLGFNRNCQIPLFCANSTITCLSNNFLSLKYQIFTHKLLTALCYEVCQGKHSLIDPHIRSDQYS